MSVAIVGWWAAGLMCAAALLEWRYDQKVFLFDRNPHLGAKVIISWWGRCNITTWFYKRQDLKNKYPNGWEFIQDALVSFWPRKIRAWFEDHWVTLKKEVDGRIFPVSDNGRDVVWAFDRLFSYHKNIHIRLRERVLDIKKDGDKFHITTNINIYQADKVVIATGWNAYRHTWSSGDGYDFAMKLWHSITKLGPSLTSFETKDKKLHELSWISFPNSRIITQDNQKFDGPLLLTHFGITWPMVFAFSAHIPFVNIDKNNPLIIKWMPNNDISYEKWIEILQDRHDNSPHKQINTVLKNYFPTRFIEFIMCKIDVNPTQIVWSFGKNLFKSIAQALGNWITVDIVWRRNGDEFVTSWWIPTKEINPKTMESLLCSWLYFWWEIMDIDWVTWGYNLTSSWATWKLAWTNIITATDKL